MVHHGDPKIENVLADFAKLLIKPIISQVVALSSLPLASSLSSGVYAQCF